MTDEFLRSILDPSTTAVLTMELQEGVVGSAVALPALAEEVRRTGTLENVRRLCASARDAGARVVHCTIERRSDGAGGAMNCRLLAATARSARQRGGDGLAAGAPGTALVDGLHDDRDIVVSRIHGLTPFTSTSLDQVLRNLGVRTVIATGVSLNIGVLGMVLSAVDLGYQVVVPRDAVVGIPRDYADAVVENTLSLLATVVPTDDVVAAWRPG